MFYMRSFRRRRREFIKPYQRIGSNVIVNIDKTIIEPGSPEKIECLNLRLKGLAETSDDEIERFAWSKMYEHLKKMPDEI